MAAFRGKVWGLSQSEGYYDEMIHLTHTILRRLWIAEGKRRGYELIDR